MVKKLDNVALITVNCDCPDEGIRALRYSKKNIDFGRTIILSSKEYNLPDIEWIKTPHISSVNEYNDFMLWLISYVDFPYVLVVQSDGFVVNADMWDDEFLKYDYIGAPWPNDPRWIDDQSLEKRRTIKECIKNNRVGNGGFSLRSKKFLEYANLFQNSMGWGEDIFLCSLCYDKAVEHNIRFAPLELAYKFSYENRCSEFGHDYREPYLFRPEEHFGFHHSNFINGQEILNLKNG